MPSDFTGKHWLLVWFGGNFPCSCKQTFEDDFSWPGFVLMEVMESDKEGSGGFRDLSITIALEFEMFSSPPENELSPSIVGEMHKF